MSLSSNFLFIIINELNDFPFQFTYEYCKFKLQKSKEGTGRIVVWNMGVMNSFTMEVTYLTLILLIRTIVVFNLFY